MSSPTREVYLDAEFKPATLKVAQLRSILLEHQIPFPSSAKKADLVAIFATQLQPRGAAILAADARVKPSSRGIVAVSSTGRESPVDDIQHTAGVKRARRPKKSTTAVSEDVNAAVDPDSPAPPPKKARSRKSSAAPSVEVELPKRRRSRKVSPPAPEEEIMIDSPDDSPEPSPQPISPHLPDPLPAATPTLSRRRSSRASMPAAPGPASEDGSGFLSRSAAAPPATEPPRRRAPRLSAILAGEEEEEEAIIEVEPTPDRGQRRSSRSRRRSSVSDDGGFSDFNPFQSGSPAAAEREHRRRKSSIGATEPKRRAPRPSEWTVTSVPSNAAPPSILRRVAPAGDDIRSPPDEVRQAMRQHIDFADLADQHNQVVQRKLNEITSESKEGDTTVQVKTTRKAIVRRKPKQETLPISALSAVLMALLTFALTGQYKMTSSSNGFCDAESSTNSVIDAREVAIADAQSCIQQRTEMRLEHPSSPSAPLRCDASVLPLVPFMPRPQTCTPCPQHAECANGEVVQCTAEYILTPHLFAPLSPLLDGLPGLESRVFPPACRPDTARMRQVGMLARQIEKELAQSRGDKLCRGDENGSWVSPVLRYGTSKADLRRSFADRRVSEVSREQFDDIFDAALDDLIKHGDVLTTPDPSAKLKARSLIDEWKTQMASTAAVLAGIAFVHSSIETRRKEAAHAKELVATVLARLQEQEQRHYTDPVQTAQPYLAPAQLRDVVLPAAELGAAARARLWDRVSAAVEANSNVMVREREVHGDVWKTWQWTGVAVS